MNATAIKKQSKKLTKARVKDLMVYGVAISILLAIAILIFSVFSMLARVKDYNYIMKTIVSDRYEIFAEHGDVKVQLAKENYKQLNYFFETAQIWQEKKEINPIDQIHFELVGEDNWSITLSELDNAILQFDVVGPSSFSFTCANEGDFVKYLKIVSVDGWSGRNIVVE